MAHKCHVKKMKNWTFCASSQHEEDAGVKIDFDGVNEREERERE